MTGEVLEALAFAAAKHRDQRRKDQAASPYINHPLAVVKLEQGNSAAEKPAELAPIVPANDTELLTLHFMRAPELALV